MRIRNTTALSVFVMVLMLFAMPATAQDADMAAAPENSVAADMPDGGDEAMTAEESEAETAGETADDTASFRTERAFLHGVVVEIPVPDGAIDLFTRNSELQLHFSSALPRTENYIALYVDANAIDTALSSRALRAIPGVKYGMIAQRSLRDSDISGEERDALFDRLETSFREDSGAQDIDVLRTDDYLVLTETLAPRTDGGDTLVTAVAHLPLRERLVKLAVTQSFDDDADVDVDGTRDLAAKWTENMIAANAETPQQTAQREAETQAQMLEASQSFRYFIQIFFVGMLLLIGATKGRTKDGKRPKAVLYCLAVSVFAVWTGSLYAGSPNAPENMMPIGMTPMPMGMVMTLFLWIVALPVGWFVELLALLAQRKLTFGQAYYRTLAVILTLWSLSFLASAYVPQQPPM